MKNKEKACLAIVLLYGSSRKNKRKRWMKEWMTKRERYSHINLLKEIALSDENDFCNYLRMDIDTYHKLIELVQPHLQRQDTNMREALSVEQRLAVTLRYFATGRSFEDLKFSALIGPRTISYAVMETCEALIFVLQGYVKVSF